MIEEANDQTTGTGELMVQNDAGCGITGDPELDDILDRVSVFGNNPVGDAFRRMMAIIRPASVLVDDEDEND
jgi:hypothetical protein